MASAQYEHSVVFSTIKAHKETRSGHLTTSQYLQILDSYLASAMAPLLSVNNHFVPFLIQVLSWQELHPKRKVSFLDRDEFRAVALRFLAGECDWLLLKLDRLLVFQYVESQLKFYKPALDACDGVSGFTRVDLSDLHATVRDTVVDGEVAPILAACRSASFWLQKATKFRNDVLEKYYRLCLRTAQHDYVQHFKHRVHLDDIVQVYIQAAGRALDKCDSTKGVLTTHVQYWLFTARSLLTKAEPREHQLDETLQDVHAEDDRPSLEDSQSRIQESEIIRELLALVDPHGLARVVFGIEESPSTILRATKSWPSTS